ncbi:hypothetical protein STCU_04050 [Strigomonas culicis]|uniref:Uncharacterized protein n=1 Tax=Strigomonas culicis TaxID=28005 RepID=S9W3N3_9TRYP|nr:hypothetical protein STCU_04050 [Strigomonas culicis]|eukprot:EPY30470.1 hypothetical protein STCU_04050 [Strigomonas culicis]
MLTFIFNVHPGDSTGALSTRITSPNNPSALQQFASFNALKDRAEEENLDWGGSGMLLSRKSTGLSRPRGMTTPPSEKSSEDGGESDSVSSQPTQLSVPHRRHRRQRRHHKGDTSSDMSLTTSEYEAESQRVHSRRMWSQLHVMEVAYSTRDNNFVHVTERFTEYQNMYPIVYQCILHEVQAPHEAALLAHPTTGLPSSRAWSCSHCGAKHSRVQEACQRCKKDGPYAKLFMGQIYKEKNGASGAIRFLHATHPTVTVHRVDPHLHADGRGKGCTSIYVDRSAAHDLIHMINGNAFFDVRDDTGDEVVHYVYDKQQAWLEQLVTVRNRQERSPTVPWAPLVLSDSAELRCE